MLAALSTYFFSLVAGSLSTLSPCVLPLIPILITSALNTHKLGPYALAVGLALSFTVVGVFLATLGISLGLDQDTFRIAAAVLLIGFGAILLSATLQERFAVAASGFSNSGQSLLNRISTDSLAGQFMLGLILGVVWSPCVDPTLDAAITLASQGQSLGHITLVMALFGIDSLDPARPALASGHDAFRRQTAARRANRQESIGCTVATGRHHDHHELGQTAGKPGAGSIAGMANQLFCTFLAFQRQPCSRLMEIMRSES